MTDAVQIIFPPAPLGVQNAVDTVAELRALDSTEVSENTEVLVAEAGFYKYDPSSLATDDGTSVLKPDDLTALQAGRWLVVTGYVTAPVLAAGSGSGVGFQRADTNSKLRNMQAKVSEASTSVLDYAGADFTTQFQNAVANCPIYSTLIIPAGAYTLTAKVSITRKINLVMEGGYIGCTFGSNVSDYAIDINVGSSGDDDNRGMLVSNLRMFVNSGTAGLIRLRNDSPNTANNGTIFERLTIAGPDVGGTPTSSSRFAIRIDGATTHKTTIRNCSSISGGIGHFAVDGLTVEDNLFGGTSCFIFVGIGSLSADFANGAFGNIIRGNVGQTRDGFLWAERGSQFHVSDNQLEQAGVNTNTYKAQVVLTGDATHVMHDWFFETNSFGGGDNCEVPLHLQGYCEEIFTDHNVWNRGALNGTNLDVRIASSTVNSYHHGANQDYRGTRAGTPDPQYPALISDAGTGSFGIVKGLAFSNSWTGASAFYVKDDYGHLLFNGPIAAGTLTANTTLFTLPVQARPRADAVMLAYDLTNNAVAALGVASATGIVKNLAVLSAGAVLDLTGCSLLAQGRKAYADWP